MVDRNWYLGDRDDFGTMTSVSTMVMQLPGMEIVSLVFTPGSL